MNRLVNAVAGRLSLRAPQRRPPFTLDLSTVRYAQVSEELWIQHLRTCTTEVLTLGDGGMKERRRG